MSAQPSKAFHVGDLLSITDGRLVSPSHINGVYQVVDFVTGQPHMTHQLPRACDVVKPWLLEQHPWLDDVEFDFVIPKGSTNDQAMKVLQVWHKRLGRKYGLLHLVEPMPLGMYVGRDPIAELQEMAPHMRVLRVEVPGDGS